jgi:hypothetical protein
MSWKLRLQTALGRGNKVVRGLQEGLRERIFRRVEHLRLASPVADNHPWRASVAAAAQRGRDGA